MIRLVERKSNIIPGKSSSLILPAANVTEALKLGGTYKVVTSLIGTIPVRISNLKPCFATK